MSDQERESASVEDQLRASFTKRPIRKMGQSRGPQRFISTGVPALDEALGDHRPRGGEILEISGDDSEAQAVLICHMLAAAQRQGGVCAYIDVTGSFPVVHAEPLGVEIAELLGSDRECGEDLLAVAAQLAGSGALDVLVLDSMPALTPRVELKGPIGQGDPGLFGEMVSKGMRKLALEMDDSSTLCLLINQNDGMRQSTATQRWSAVRPTAATLDRYVARRLEIRRLTKQAEQMVDPTRWRVRLRVIETGAPEAALELDLELEYGKGIIAVVSSSSE